jgi:dienelactone hydrolase
MGAAACKAAEHTQALGARLRRSRGACAGELARLSCRAVSRPLALGSGLALAVYRLAAAWLGRLELSGPPHADVVLDGGIPATLYLPGAEGLDPRSAFLEPPPRDARPPGVVLMHGFASDRLGVSSLARRLAGSGYVVLAFDASGHGQNRNPFRRGFARADAFDADYAAAVEFLRGYPHVDGERIAVMGHSMGAGASLDYASRDAGLDAAVLISGGSASWGPVAPRNALFLYASGDPERIAARAQELAARLAGVDAVLPGKTYGDPAQGSGVRLVEIAGADHATIVWTAAAAGEIVRWLDACFGRAPQPRSAPQDPRFLAVALCALALPGVLAGLGALVGRLVPAHAEPLRRNPAAGLAMLTAALLLCMPLLAADTPAAFLSVEVGDVVASHLALAGIGLLVWLAARGHTGAGLFREPWRLLAGAGLGALSVYVLMLPIGSVVHRMTLTPERMLVLAAASAVLLPFSLAFQRLLRRGPPVSAALSCALGRVLVLAVLGIGVALGLLSPVVMLMLPALALVFALLEVLAASLYAASRNLAAIALIDAVWLAFTLAAVMPLRG